MGAYDGAEVCELVGLYVLSLLENKINADSIGLYRDDGLAVVRNKSGTQCDRMRKQLIKIFQEIGLKITVDVSLKQVNFLDASMDLNTGTHTPFRKPNNLPVYINVSSNHPQSIIKQIPAAVEKRISALSSNEEIFNQASKPYNDALRSSGYSKKIKYIKDCANKRKPKKARRREITWFNPPFSKHVKSNIGGTFFRLLDKHFPPGSKLHKIFNRNCVKLSYSCMRNMGSVIKAHNAKITKMTETTSKKCNCRKKDSCPLRGKCLTSKVVYKATVVSGNASKIYIGQTGNTFKDRFNNHKKSFRHVKYEKETELSKYVWDLKKKQKDFEIKWEIMKESNTERRQLGQCNLCVEEKLEILNHNTSTDILNKKTELIVGT